ncbi:MAG TPA: Nif3-like dinuclear metal center hexameric protein [Candidatus Onthomorpha intestinigallinarum]|uniref:GTP cyclohydrolase 1 type 2 homolog n=1 Tax=Candidatus Onthomorpha intestinigallinarum TaxID=2840880 RepID=A0A9D1RIC4_9BACT|nr:Nif3-like dinuclear metal center hexameric protein [Candidatus Onthomorpha intestinigallinarum]
MIKTADIIHYLNEQIPETWQEDYDNSGLLCGNTEECCNGIFLCLDIDINNLKKAKNLGCNLIISHHPLVFKSIKRFLPKDNPTEALLYAIENNMTIYSMHTNLDAAQTGLNTMLAQIIGLQDFTSFDKNAGEKGFFGIGGTGILPKKMNYSSFLLDIKTKLNIHNIRYVPGKEKILQSVALCTGSGGELLEKAIEAGADCYLTSDIKYHTFLEADGRILLADIGHFESESIAKKCLANLISKKFCNFVPLFCDDSPNKIKNI